MTLKVLYIAHNHPSVRPGGAEQHALELHRAMAAIPGVESVLLTKGGPPVGQIGRVHEGTFVAPVGSRADEYFLHTDGYYFDYLNGTTTSKQLLTKHLRTFLLAIKPDVVHIQHTLFLGYDLIREVHNTLPRAPIVYTLHEYLPICSRDGQMIRTATNELCDHASPNRCHECFPQITAQAFLLRQRFIQAQLGLVDVFLAPSRFLMQKYVEWGIPTDKIQFEDYGRTYSLPRAEPPEMHRNRLGFFGQFSPYKGVDVLLEAMRLIELDSADGSVGADVPNRRKALSGHLRDTQTAPAQPRVTLKLHGANLDLQEGEFKRTFARLLEETRDCVTLVGRYSQERLPELMRDVDWVVVPSIWWENSPLVIQEAFMNGRPVICSDVGGMAEKVTDGLNGLHFRVGDPTSLAAAIRRAVQSPAIWDEMRRGIPPIYRLDDQVTKLRDLYGQLLASRLARSQVHAAID
jgi:glycosyltransferase involved in cell wall biosynthesis